MELNPIDLLEKGITAFVAVYLVIKVPAQVEALRKEIQNMREEVNELGVGIKSIARFCGARQEQKEDRHFPVSRRL